KDGKKKKKKSKRISKSKKRRTVSKKARAKEDSSPLKAEIKSEDNIRKLADDMKDEEIETKKLTPVVEENIPEEVGEAEEEIEIKDEQLARKPEQKKIQVH
ncbi:hypothetical protein T05_7894, partial [Trichinella murrelli]